MTQGGKVGDADRAALKRETRSLHMPLIGPLTWPMFERLGGVLVLNDRVRPPWMPNCSQDRVGEF